MTIPTYDALHLEALTLLQDGASRKLREFELPLAKVFSLSDEEISQMYNSGNGPVFYYRIGWALSYLNMAGLVDKPKRGVYLINDLGLSFLKKPEQLEDYIQAKVRERTNQKKENKDLNKVSVQLSELTPEEHLYQSYHNIKQSIYNEILDTILSKSPYAFEHLVVTLLEKMGYGGELKNAGEVTQASNDGGIDGVIREDVLGFGKIHIQAKRYSSSNTVGREEVQKFVGALAVAQSSKGVFITTSTYSNGAIKYVKNLNGNTTIVLIDGLKLAEYIYDFNLGMQTEQTIELKKLDGDFWDAIQDDKP